MPDLSSPCALGVVIEDHTFWVEELKEPAVVARTRANWMSDWAAVREVTPLVTVAPCAEAADSPTVSRI